MQYQRDRVDGWTGYFWPAEGTLYDNPNGRLKRSRFPGEPGMDRWDVEQRAVGYRLDRLCQMKGILQPGQYDEALDILTKVGEVLKNALAEMNLTLIDFKIEIGYDTDGKMYVVDEITPDIWRVKDEDGNIPNQIDCAQLLLDKIQ